MNVTDITETRKMILCAAFLKYCRKSLDEIQQNSDLYHTYMLLVIMVFKYNSSINLKLIMSLIQVSIICQPFFFFSSSMAIPWARIFNAQIASDVSHKRDWVPKLLCTP